MFRDCENIHSASVSDVFQNDIDQKEDVHVEEIIKDVMDYVMPSWPLQNAVAVNPFWNLRNKKFTDVMCEMKTFHHKSGFYNFSDYLRFYEKGDIYLSSLEKAFLTKKNKIHIDFNGFLEKSKQLSSAPQEEFDVQSYTEFYLGHKWQEIILAEAGNHAARYLDDRQSLVVENKDQSFWCYWLESQVYDASMKYYGFENFSKCFNVIKSKDPIQAISYMVQDLGLHNAQSIRSYLQRNLSFVLGWSSVFAKYQWEKSVGYELNAKTHPVDMLCVMVAYDYGVFIDSKKENKSDFVSKILNSHTKHSSVIEHLKSTWHLAWEWTNQEKFHKNFTYEKKKESQNKFQMIFCIDVRSEILRKSIESQMKNVETIGFAGFFGLPIEYKMQQRVDVQKRLPVLLKSAYQIEKRECHHAKKMLSSSVSKFLKNMRKQSFSSFSYVEFFGFLSFFSLLYEAFFPFWRKGLSSDVYQVMKPEDVQILKSNGYDHVSLDELADSCANILRHLGIQQYAEHVIVVGHGSQTQNNAFASALHCGACGGHSGDMNSQVLCHVMNRSDVRNKLKEVYHIDIPVKTVFIPALHETVTDEIHFLSDNKHHDLRGFQENLLEAAKLSQAHRNESFGFRDDVAQRRATNWAEVRPEWGLTGNHSFVVAPRSRTQKSSLDGRSFLHDYEWRTDQGFKTLELIMTAPMVVTSWINLQYYYSSMIPEVYGAGNKILHNLVNEVGVYEGNGGDLRIGLPIQSVHDGEKYLHDSFRLSVYIEAPIDAIESIIRKHEHVKDLIQNGWIHLLRIDEDGRTYRRSNSGDYDPLI